MNILQYTLTLTDKMSAALNRIGGSSDRAVGGVRNLRNEAESLNKVNLGGFLSSIKRVSAVLGVGAVLGKSIKDGMEMGMKNVSFEVLFGGEEPAKRMIDNITAYASKAYGQSAVTNAVQMMKGFDLATEEIMPNLRAIGDIAMGDTNKFNSLTLAFSQMSSTGKLMGQDLLQMINAGFNPLVQMSKTTGKSVALLKDEMSKGLITSQMVKQAFYDATAAGGQYNGMIEKMSNTTGGLWNNALSKMNQRLLQFYNWIEPILIPALKKFNEFLDDPIGTIGRLVDKVTTAYPVISGAIIGITAAVIGYKVAMLSLAGVQAVIAGLKAALVAYEIVVFAVKNATSVWAAVQWLLNVALTANPIGIIIAAIVALIAVIAFLVIKVDGWGEMWQHTVNGAKLIFKAFVESVKFYFNTMINGLMIGINKIKEGWYEFKEAVGLGDSSENQRALQKIREDTDARKAAIVDGAKTVAKLGIEAANEFKKAGQSLSWNDTSFSDVTASIKKKLGIADPAIPGGGNLAGSTNNGIGGGTGSGTAANTANAIATGGTKTTNINVSIGEFANNMRVTANGAKESATEMRDMILDELTRVLSMAQGQAV